MDLNLSKLQYQQYAEKGQFDPVTQVELSPGMQRESDLYSQDLQNYYDWKAYNDKINITNAEIKGQDLVQLAEYSSTFTKQLVDRQEKLNEKAKQEEYSRFYRDGVADEDMAKYRSQIEEMETARAQGNYTKAKLIEQGVPWLLTHKVDEMSGWRKVGAVLGLTESLATNQYPADQQKFLASLDPGMSTPEKQKRLAEWRQGWMSNVGFSETNPALLEDKAFPVMRRTDAAAISSWITADENRAKDNLEEEAMSLLSTNAVNNFARAQEYYVETGRYTRAQARAKALGQINDNETLDKVAGTMSWDGKTLNGKKYEKDFYNRRVEILREAEGRRDYDRDSIELAGAEYADQNIEAWERETPSASTVEKAIEQSRLTYGGFVDPRLKQWESMTTDAKKRKAWKEYLDRRLAAGTLSQSVLNDEEIPWDIAQSYRSKVPNEKELTDQTSPEIKQLQNDLTKNVGKEGQPIDSVRLTPGLELAKDHATALYLQRRQENITSGAFASVAEAEQEAYQYVKGLVDLGNPDLTKKGEKPQGDFAFDRKRGYYVFSQPRAGLQETRAAARQEQQRVDSILNAWQQSGKPFADMLNTMPLLTDAQVDDAVQNSSGYGWSPPAMAEYISAKSGGKYSAWEVVERQAQARRGQGIYIPSSIRAADEQIPQTHKDALNTFPSYNRTMRALASTNQFVPRVLPQNLGTEVERLAEANGLDPALLAGVVSYETNNFRGDKGSNINALEKTAPILAERLKEHNGNVRSALMSMGVGQAEGYEGGVLRTALKYGYGANGNVFRAPGAMNPSLAYITGNIGPTSTGPHLDVKRKDGSFFEYADLDEYVVIDDPDLGRVPLSAVRETGDWQSHTRRGSHGRDYGTASGTKVYLKNGARVVDMVKTEHGDKLFIQLPTGEIFTFLHGEVAN
jgi:hypothetical protein